jgi:uncharacterized protein (TIGR02596 family)
MRSTFAASARQAGPRAFTLVELLVVLTIVAIVSALVIPSVGPMMSSYNLNQAGSMVSDELSFARQAALTRNADVEVRFYQTGTTAKATDLQFRAFRSFLANSTAPTQAVALDKLSYLPGNVIISSTADPANSPSTFSPLLDYTNHSTVLTTGTDTLPNGTSATYVSFLFRATGGTNLVPVATLWYVTVCPENAKTVTTTGLPGNYVTVQVDPVIGQVRTFRP